MSLTAIRSAAMRLLPLLAALLFAALAGGAVGLSAGRDAGRVPDPVLAAMDSVVTLHVEHLAAGLDEVPAGAGFGDAAALRTPAWRTGTAFAVAEGGYLLTNFHVVDGARRMDARLADGRRIRAELVAGDAVSDLALVRLREPAGLTPLDFAPAGDLGLGEPVWAVGAPLGYAASLTGGIVSGFDRAYDAVDPIGYVQHDAPLNPGSSGGPLLDRRGRVAGVNTAIPQEAFTDVGIGLAIPAADAARTMRELLSHGRVERGALGVTVQALDDALAAALAAPHGGGLVVDHVLAGSPAEEIGLAPGAVLVSIDGEALAEPRDLNRVLMGRRPGEPVSIVWRLDGTRMEAQVDLAARHRLVAERPAVTERGGPAGTAPSGDGFGLELAADSAGDDGLPIGHVGPDSPAEQAGLRPGDRVLAVGADRVADPAEAHERLRQGGEVVALRVRRQGEETPRYLVLSRSVLPASLPAGPGWPAVSGGPF